MITPSIYLTTKYLDQIMPKLIKLASKVLLPKALNQPASIRSSYALFTGLKDLHF